MPKHASESRTETASSVTSSAWEGNWSVTLTHLAYPPMHRATPLQMGEKQKGFNHPTAPILPSHSPANGSTARRSESPLDSYSDGEGQQEKQTCVLPDPCEGATADDERPWKAAASWD
ncbi:uncharacterized protein LOC144057501 isoform X1 [Vanacampus margaritifer]